MDRPTAGCCFMISHSAASSLPGLSSTASGVAILPMSCMGAAWRNTAVSSSDMPAAVASRWQISDMRRTWLPASFERDSTTSPRRRISSAWVSVISWVSRILSKAIATPEQNTSSSLASISEISSTPLSTSSEALPLLLGK